jgi:hypothetical protein
LLLALIAVLALSPLDGRKWILIVEFVVEKKWISEFVSMLGPLEDVVLGGVNYCRGLCSAAEPDGIA